MGDLSPMPITLGVLVNLSEADFGIAHRAVLRTSWRQAVARLLSAQQGSDDGASDTGEMPRASEAETSLVQLFSEGMWGNRHDGIDVFISYYIRKTANGEAADFGRKRRDLADTIARQAKRGARARDQ